MTPPAGDASTGQPGMNAGELLRRVARTLRQEIGPAIGAEYPRTQAFMAAVVLDKLGGQLARASAHREADAAALRALLDDVSGLLAGGAVPDAVAAAVEALARSGDRAGPCVLIEAIYACRSALGAARFEALRGRVRQTLRADIDRRMEYAG